MTFVPHPGSIVGLPRLTAPTDFAESLLSRAYRQPILLGLFLPI